MDMSVAAHGSQKSLSFAGGFTLPDVGCKSGIWTQVLCKSSKGS